MAATEPIKNATAPSGNPYYLILSFCGGGIRGLISSGLLDRLYHKFPTLISQTNLFAGTSTGADIISQIVANKTPATIYESYLLGGPVIFFDPSKNPNAPAYNVNKLVEVQQKMHGQTKLSDLSQSVLFTSFNVGSKDQHWKPLLFNNLPKSTNADTLVVDAVVSSSAMSGMYGSYNGNVDGAFVNHDPTLAAIALAVNQGISLQDIVVVCFGTGFMPNYIASDTSNWGAHQWQNGDGNTANNVPPLLINGTVCPILNMTLNGTSTNLVPNLASMMLQNRYVYLNPTLSKYIPENDINPLDLIYLAEQVGTYDFHDAENLLNTVLGS